MDYITMFADAYIYVQIVINIKNVGFVLAATFQGPLHGFYAPCPRAPSRCWHARRSIYIILFHRTCTLLNPTVPEKKNHWNHGKSSIYRMFQARNLYVCWIPQDGAPVR